MSGFLTSPTFSPPVGPIALGSNAQVLTMVGGVPAFAAAAGGGAASLGTRLAYASPAGGAVAAAPAGASKTTGRLDVTLPGGNATWISLTIAGAVDGQLLVIRNDDALNTLVLPAADFGGVIDLNLPPKARALVYFDATDALWERTS